MTTLTTLTIDRLETFAVALPSLRSFSVAGGSVTKEGSPSIRVLVKVTGSNGAVGWGEATPIPAWTYETVESITTTIDRYLRPVTEGRRAWDLDGLAAVFDRVINRGFTIGAPLAKSAVDVAVLDLVGRTLGVSVSTLWGQRRRDSIELAWIVSGQTPDKVAAAIEEGHAHGYRSFKVKVGLTGRVADLDVVRTVRESAPDAVLWVDANQGYTIDDAIWQSQRMAELDVAAFEQPLPANDIVGLKRLRNVSAVPIALDESLRHPSDLATFIKLDAIDIAIAKVQRSGGLTLSRRLCSLADDSGLKLMGSGLTDSDLGLAASLHLFGAFGIDTPTDLNGRQFVESPYVGAHTVIVENGVAQVPEGPGLGVDVDESIVRELAITV